MTNEDRLMIKQLARKELRTYEEMIDILIRMGLREYRRLGWDKQPNEIDGLQGL